MEIVPTLEKGRQLMHPSSHLRPLTAVLTLATVAALVTTGRAAEKTQSTDKALHLYSKGESAKCSERTMRLMLAHEDRDVARRQRGDTVRTRGG